MKQHDASLAPRHDRREFLRLGIGAFVVAAAFPWVTRGQPTLVRRSIPVMGTVADFAVAHRDSDRAQAAIDAALAELRFVEATMTRFRADSDIGRVNLGAALGPVPVSDATAAVLADALVWAAASGGRFDPAVGGAVALWDVTHRTEPPAPGELSRFAGAVLYRQVELARWRDTQVVVFHAPGVALDLGGIAKGYAVDRAVLALREHGIQHALVNAGGDLYALGSAPGGAPWQVGIRSPDDPARLAATLRLEDAAVATSGDYTQFFEHAGRRYHHLLDPVTAEPRRTAVRSVTVTAPTCGAADAGATASFGCARDDAERILSSAARGARLVHLV